MTKTLIKIAVSVLALPILWVVYSLIRLNFAETLPLGLAVDGHKVQWVLAYDTQVAYQKYGVASANTLLLVHGTGAWSGTWVSNVDAMVAAGYQVIAMDLPPFGFSGQPNSKDYSRQAQAQRIAAFADALALKQPVLLGHSFGGGPAAEAALVHPEKFRALVFVDAALGPIGSTPMSCDLEAAEIPFTRLAIYSAVVGMGTQPFMSQTLLEKFVARKEIVTAGRTAVYQVPFQKRGFSFGVAEWAYQFSTRCETALSSHAQNYANLGIPTDIIWGEADTITPMAQGEHLNRLIKGSQLHRMAGVGHIPQIEDVSSFNQLITTVLVKRRH